MPSIAEYPIFTWESYREFLPHIARARTSSFPEYQARLPMQMVACCPYCGQVALLPVDLFSLFGFHPHSDEGRYGRFRAGRWQGCRHMVTVTVALGLNGLQPDDLPGWMDHPNWYLRIAPSVIAWPLLARHTSAVVHAIGIARLDDAEYIPRYTAYFSTYYAAPDSNLMDEAHFVHTDIGTAATSGVHYDEDLLKWLDAERLFWLDDAQAVNTPRSAFPYGSVEPRGFIKLEQGRAIGPKPLYLRYNGPALPHDQSVERSFELD